MSSVENDVCNKRLSIVKLPLAVLEHSSENVVTFQGDTTTTPPPPPTAAAKTKKNSLPLNHTLTEVMY